MTDIKVPNLDCELYPHQLSSIYHLERREQTKRISTGAMEITTNLGIFSDIGGYGKTLSLTALIVRNRLPWNLEEPYTRASLKYHDSSGAVFAKRYRAVSDEKCNATLVIALANTTPQWTASLKKTQLSFFVLTAEEDLVTFSPDEMDVIVCSYALYQSFVGQVSRVWKRVIFDDPGGRPTSKMHSLNAGFIWFVTDATAFSDSFRHRRISPQHFIKALFGRMPVEIFQSLVVKNNDSYVSRSWPIAPPHHAVYSCDEKNNQTIEIVETMGGLIKDDPEILLEKEECPICLEGHSSEVVHLQCCHKKFGGDCLVRWFKEEKTRGKTCPHCRCLLSGDHLVYYSGPRYHRTRHRTVVHLIRSYPEGKFILFSTLRDHFRALQSLLKKAGILWGILYGTVADEKTLAQFRQGVIQVLLLSAKQPGTGLNFEFATDLIVYHDISPTQEAVLVTRAHRIGRTAPDPLRIHHLKLA